MPPEYNIRSVDRALAVLDCYDLEHTSFSLVELAKKIELSASTTLRLVTTLENRNYLFRNPDNGRYYLGSRIAQLGNNIFSNLDICQIAQPFLRELCTKYNESVGIYQRNGDVRVCITRINSNQTLRSVLMIGATYPLTRGAAGRILLAYAPPEVQNRLLTADPFTNIGALHSLKETGFTISNGERDTAVESIAVPIFNANRSVDHALFMTGPAGRLASQSKDDIVQTLRDTAMQISIQMGYRPQD